MAQKTQILLVDDIDGSPADETVRFAVDGVEYETDLTTEHAQALRESFADWISHARRTSGRKSAGRRAPSSTKASDAKQVREWARENGYTVPDRGRIPAKVRKAYDAAH